MTELNDTDKLDAVGKTKLESYLYLMGVTDSVKKQIMARFGGNENDTLVLALLLDTFRDCVIREEQLQRCVMHNIVKENDRDKN